MKEEILRLLRSADGYISGQELCNRFGVSRTAVWKAINQLKEAGYEIEAQQNKGYRLMAAPDLMTEAEIKSLMHTEWVAKEVLYFDTIDSTNIKAQELAEKGMNLDRVREQLGEMKAERARLEAELTAPRAEQSVLPLLRAYAKAAGGNMETLTAQMMQAVRQAGIPIEQPKAGTYLQDKAVSDWKAFLKAYPDIRDPRTELPKEVWERINQGVTPVNAMIEHRQADLLRQIAERDAKIKEFEQKEQAREQNEKNKKRAGGSLTSTAGGGEKDGFLSGFLDG